MSQVNILVQDTNNNWVHVKTVDNINDQYVRQTLEQTAWGFRGKRLKAVDSSTGSLIDLYEG